MSDPGASSIETSRLESGAASGRERTGGLRAALLSRQIDHYPSQGQRLWLLGVVTVTTIVLYYIYFVPGSVLPLLLPYYHMSFLYFLTLVVISNGLGAATAFIGGLSDRIGRGNLTVYGLLVVGLLQFAAIPNAHSVASFDIAYVAIGFVEGIILVVTPALIRDFSPQMGRATAMGFWALGPVLGSLTVSQVATHTLNHLRPWQDQFVISGAVCLGMFVLAFFFLRELAPAIRDQLVVSANERALIEARAKGIDIEQALQRPLRTMMKPDLMASSFAVSVFLLLYYAVVTIITLYWFVVFSKTTADANGINTWFFVFDALGLVVMGVLSDRLMVRKPFMLAGALAYIIVSVLFLDRAHHPHTSYYELAVLMALLGFTSATAYSPWMASYTEAVEEKNPALSATGLAIWGWILRIVVAISFLVIPHVISSATTIVDNQEAANALQALQAAAPYAKNPLAPQTPPPPVRAKLLATDPNKPVGRYAPPLRALYDYLVTKKLPSLTSPQGTYLLALQAFTPVAQEIQAGQRPSSAQVRAVASKSQLVASLIPIEEQLIPAQAVAADQWQHWWWVCVGGEVIFFLLIFTMQGRWSPREARKDYEEHQQRVAVEMKALGIA
jgi:MFS family permease